MLDLLFPADDTTVLVEFAVMTAIGIALLVVLRRRPDLRLFAGGLWLLGISLMALRALH